MWSKWRGRSKQLAQAGYSLRTLHRLPQVDLKTAPLLVTQPNPQRTTRTQIEHGCDAVNTQHAMLRCCQTFGRGGRFHSSVVGIRKHHTCIYNRNICQWYETVHKTRKPIPLAKATDPNVLIYIAWVILRMHAQAVAPQCFPWQNNPRQVPIICYHTIQATATLNAWLNACIVASEGKAAT